MIDVPQLIVYPKGKSVLVRGLCRRLDVPMIQVTPSLLLRKYVGETSQMTKAVFSLAAKLQPCVLFVDEMDALFRTRTSDDAAVDRNIKTECMSGFLSFCTGSFHSNMLHLVSHAVVGRPPALAQCRCSARLHESSAGPGCRHPATLRAVLPASSS